MMKPRTSGPVRKEDALPWIVVDQREQRVSGVQHPLE